MKKIIFFLIAAFFSSAVYSQDIKTTDIKNSQLPKETQVYISRNLPDAIITRAAKAEENGVLSYLVVVEVKGQKHAYLFDRDGKFTCKDDKYLPKVSVAKSPEKTQLPVPPAQPSGADNTAPKKD